MPPESQTKNTSLLARLVAVFLVVAYVITICAVAALVRPIEVYWLVAIALLPAVVCLLFGIPKVVKPRGLMALFHLFLYPLFAAIAFGIPAAYVTFKLAQLFGP